MGNIETRDYKNQSGDTVYRTEIIAKEFGGRIEVQHSNKLVQEDNDNTNENPFATKEPPKDDVIPF